MLGVSSYPQDFIDACRARIDDQLAGYDALAGGANAEFDREFFRNLVLVLDHSFMHRLRGQEGKDGNPMNEVRLLVTSILENDGRLVADKQIKLKPESSVLGLSVGDEIVIGRDDFARLADAYFKAIEQAFGG